MPQLPQASQALRAPAKGLGPCALSKTTRITVFPKISQQSHNNLGAISQQSHSNLAAISQRSRNHTWDHFGSPWVALDHPGSPWITLEHPGCAGLPKALNWDLWVWPLQEGPHNLSHTHRTGQAWSDDFAMLHDICATESQTDITC